MCQTRYCLRRRHRFVLLLLPFSIFARASASCFVATQRSFSTIGRLRRILSAANSVEGQRETLAPSFWFETKVASSTKEESFLRQCQSRASPVASSFVPTKYDPLPLFTNCHLQTIGGVFLRNQPNCAYVTKNGWDGIASTAKAISSAFISDRNVNQDEYAYWDERECIDTPDGDFFHVDYKYHGSDARGTVILLNGIESNSNSTLSAEIANAYHRLGLEVACINYRGCSGVPNKKLGGYHFGFTDDLRQFLGILNERREHQLLQQGKIDYKSPLYVSGVSLGANIVLKALGELGESALTHYNIQGAAVAGAPFDIERNNEFANAEGFNRLVYVRSFLKTMKEKCKYQLEMHCNNDPDTDVFDFKLSMAAEKQSDIENGWTAPVYEFDNHIDYYRKVSCGNFLDGIAVPTLILNAGDDPLFDPNYFPIEQSCDGGGAAPIKMVRTEYGGHLGYLFHRPGPDDVVTGVGPGRVSSWMPTELARFLEHVHTHPLCADEN